tara:strand:+ start:116 stop:568 length:453 start_codon:yes stop_codon:yes gene_type:complete
MLVKLTEIEMEIAGHVGVRRRAESRARNRAQGPGYNEAEAWRNDIEGAAAEMAYCKGMGIYWPGSVNSFKDADCGKLTQVRQTHHHNGCLIVRDRDPDEHFYVLVVGHCPAFNIVGWIRGFDAKKNEFVRCPGEQQPAYFVPQKKLNPEW